MRQIHRSVICAAALIGVALPALAEEYSADEIKRRLIQSRAVEAAIWGMPAVNYDLMLQEMLTETPGKVGQVIYWGRPLDSKNQTLTPNPDALYFMVFFNTKDGPVVLDLPPGDANGSFNGNIVTVWQMPMEDAGLMGFDKGKGGKYLILPPGYKDGVPEGFIPLQSDVYGGYMLFRANLKSHSDEDVARSIAYGKRMKIYPLSAADNPPDTVFTDVKDVDFDSTIRYDASFFQHLDRIVQSEPWLARDRAMIDQLKSIGIEKGKPFNPDEATTKALESGIREAHAFLEAKYDAGMPLVNGFWSLTLYNEHHFFAPNEIKRYSTGTKNKGLKYNPDGSLTILVQADAPPAAQRDNWLPAPKGGDFTLYVRAYWPKAAVMDGSWTPPPVKKVATQEGANP